MEGSPVTTKLASGISRRSFLKSTSLAVTVSLPLHVTSPDMEQVRAFTLRSKIIQEKIT